VLDLNKKYVLKEQDALLVTDIQIDFLPGGALPIDNGDTIIPVVNTYIKRFEIAEAQILASRDWHPLNHISFKTQEGLWPPHCVQGTRGAEFSPALKLPNHTMIISKATEPNHEAYSAFDGTNLDGELQQLGVKRLFVCGLATDYCVVNTVLDACELGYETVVLMDAILGIDANPGDVDRAIKEMVRSGASQATDADFSEAEETFPVGEAEGDVLAAKSSLLSGAKKKARLRPKTANRRLKSERG
jgi:nicotinamidase/pyrazinamidase